MNDFEVGLVQTHPSRRLRPVETPDYAPSLTPVPQSPPLCGPGVQRWRFAETRQVVVVVVAAHVKLGIFLLPAALAGMHLCFLAAAAKRFSS